MSTFVPRVKPKSKRKIEAEAFTFLKQHFPERLEKPGRLDVLELWELLQDSYGLKPGVEDLSDGTEGMTWPDGRVLVSEATYRGVVSGNGRSRFTMCHEAYHGLAHRKQIRNVLVDTGELALFRRSELAPAFDPEWQANVFAASILMPWPMVRQVLREAADKPVEDLMYFFRVSYTAADIRRREFKRRQNI
jgi:hypothetical protein